MRHFRKIACQIRVQFTIRTPSTKVFMTASSQPKPKLTPKHIVRTVKNTCTKLRVAYVAGMAVVACLSACSEPTPQPQKYPAASMPNQTSTAPSPPSMPYGSATSVPIGEAVNPTTPNYGGGITYSASLPPQVQSFVDQNQATWQQYGIDIYRVLEKQQPNYRAIQLVSPFKQPLKRNWLVYRSRFIEPVRIQAGVQFWQQYRPLLEQVEQTFGVPKEVVLGILGVESIYGRQMGNFDILNTLYTLAFFYPDTPNRLARQQMFSAQLLDYLIWSKQQGNMQHVGSFAAAMGMPQFMPTSVRKYAVDFDGDGKIDLNNSVPDITASVANFLKQHGWITGAPVLSNIPKNAFSAIQTLATGVPQATIPLSTLRSMNLSVPASLTDADKALIIDLPSGVDVDYKMGFHNFYVLTRYNQSFFYALSVYELGQAIKSQAGY